MCFSATASITASALLLPAGFYALKKASNIATEYSPIASIPIGFGIQQAMEAGVWAGFSSGDTGMIHSYSLGFMFFSHFFWLFWVPMSVWYLEQKNIKKDFFLILTIVGFFYGAAMYFPVLINQDWLTVRLVNGFISYDDTRLIYDPILSRDQMRLIYAIIVLVALLSSTSQYIRYFGLLISVSIVLARLFFDYAFVSIWCYFAAVLSLYIVGCSYIGVWATLQNRKST